MVCPYPWKGWTLLLTPSLGSCSLPSWQHGQHISSYIILCPSRHWPPCQTFVETLIITHRSHHWYSFSTGHLLWQPKVGKVTLDLFPIVSIFLSSGMWSNRLVLPVKSYFSNIFVQWRLSSLVEYHWWVLLIIAKPFLETYWSLCVTHVLYGYLGGQF